MKYAIDETELARLEELAAKALTLPFEDMAADGWGYVVVDILPAVTTAVPALIAEIRRMRAEIKQDGVDYCALMDRHDAQFVQPSVRACPVWLETWPHQ